MIRHIVMWDFKDELTHQDKLEAAQKMKDSLEKLKDEVSGVIELEVIIQSLATSNADLMLYSSFESEKHLEIYQNHPKHRLAGQFISSVTVNRRCVDYMI
ncbi:Dabb family protein [Paludicola sp. MB14-C6]|uniref:Dabb family protein n=1 Tax=Paludihabitans sp. MB14-C6 TaxID=3070656 RepID=UPI0027DD4625|nr:Dabb family protein [Paludicola sp. MB14-C6]WMJ23235.1 Dabb family protein [Paludicola sp. MB14-C6]